MSMRHRLRSLASATLAVALCAGGAMAQQATPPPDHSSTQASAKPPAAKPTPAEDNAFPEAQSEAAAKQAAADQSADEKASGAGSAVAPNAPGEAGSSSRDKLSGLDLLGDNDSRIANGAGGVILDPKLSAQDLKVGQQYMQMGDYPGAYSRFKEACAVNPDNLDAVFYLAEAARKTAHLDESAQNYKLYLQVQPEGSKAKAARKALAQLQGK